MPARARHPILFAALWMSGTICSFATMSVAARELSHHMSTFQILLCRGIVGVVVLSLLLSYYGWHQAKTKRLGLHVTRNLFHLAGQAGWIYGIACIPLAEVVAVEFTSPVWTTLLAVAFLGERFRRVRVLAITLGVLGVLIVLRPGAKAIDPASLAVLGGAFAYAVTYIMTKRLTPTESPLAIVFYMTIVQLPINFAIAIWQPMPAFTPGIVAGVLVVGLTALTGHYCLSRALALGDAMVVIPIDFLRLPLTAALAALFYAERPSVWVFAGALVILAGNLLNIRAEHQAHRAMRTSEAAAEAVHEP